MRISQELQAIYDRRGAQAYLGEAVSMTEHGLQAAHFARAAGAPEALIVAALLHDIGHLLMPVAEDIADWQHDARHELIGGGWLARRFGPEVSEPVRLHVPAKRYLCAVDAAYLAKLSPASVLTLKLQGGAMAAAQLAAFESEPYWREAIQVRRWDDEGKVAGLRTADFSEYGASIDRLALASSARGPASS
jgi:phosphonate degradation associated HDIG domain protein